MLKLLEYRLIEAAEPEVAWALLTALEKSRLIDVGMVVECSNGSEDVAQEFFGK